MPLRVTTEVKQGNPFSPITFNILMGQLLQTLLPQEYGVTFNNQTIRVIAFADDRVVFVDSAVGLQQLADHTAAFLRDCGMALNNSRSHTAALFGHLGETDDDVSATIKINGQAMHAYPRRLMNLPRDGVRDHGTTPPSTRWPAEHLLPTSPQGYAQITTADLHK